MSTTMQERSAARFALITAGHHFLLDVLPFRRPESSYVLQKFVASVERLSLPMVDYDAVLLRCLTVLDSHALAYVPRLVDRYLSDAFTPLDCLARFSRCVEDFLRYECVSDGSVQEALYFLSTRYSEPSCTPRLVADSLGMRLPTLNVAFKRQTGATLTEHIRHLRLERAAILLATTKMSIKEIWAEVGYNHHSNFDHDFRRRFQRSPRDYRAHALRPVAQDLLQGGPGTHIDDSRDDNPSGNSVRILIVDDDEETKTTLVTFLRQEGYYVSLAASGAEGLREIERIVPNVILVDYRLGSTDMDGLEFLKLLRQRTDASGASVAIFTADWDVLDYANEVHSLSAIVASKLCDLDQVKDLVLYLSAKTDRPVRLTSLPWWRRSSA